MPSLADGGKRIAGRQWSVAMTVAAQVPPQGPTAIFSLIADFLEKTKFRNAAKAVRAQLAEKDVVHEADLSKNLRDFVDSSALILADSEAAIAASAVGLRSDDKVSGEADQALEQLIDGLLRRLMAAGHSLSDDKLNSSIEGVLNSEAFSKLAMADGALDGGIPGGPDDLGVSDVDVHKYWEQIQRESMADGTLAKAGVGGAAATAEAGGAAPELAPEPQQPQQQPVQVQHPPQAAAPSAHYVPRKPRGNQEPAEETVNRDFEEGDEYHDDDDPGYRIREIYETELLAELSAKMAQGRVPGAPAAATTASAKEAPAGEVVDELASATQAGAPPPSPAVAWPGEEGGTAGAVTGVGGSGGEAATSGARGGDEEKRSSSPTFGGEATSGAPAPATNTTAEGASGSEATAGASTAAPDAAAVAAEEAAEQQHRERRKQKHRKNVKYAVSGDPFYPVELDGIVYDSFGLRVVFERDKTGFEESKEFPIRMNSVVAARYQILEYLGSAAFSRAVQCLDLENNKMVCMKIIKNEKDFFDQSLDEIKLLKYINVNGDVDENCVLRLYDYFYHKEHLIIVTELLRDNLYEFSKFNRECGDEPYFTLGRLQKIAKQVLTALDYVHSLRLIHCDLKPENILIRSYSRCEVKVIDFGSSCFVDDHLTSYVQSRSYRAPEVMLGLPYDQKIDLWSLGCILAELWTGYVLFQNDSVQSLLARILGIIGDFPYHLMTRGRYVPQYFTQDGQLYQEIDGPACPERGRRLHLLVPKKTCLRQRMRTESEEFLDFLGQLLQLDPVKRPTAAEALQHPWITRCKYPDGLP